MISIFFFKLEDVCIYLFFFLLGLEQKELSSHDEGKMFFFFVTNGYLRSTGPLGKHSENITFFFEINLSKLYKCHDLS